MNAKHLIAAVLEMIVKVVVIAAAIMIIFRGATQAYDFGYRVFADEPVSVTAGRTITVGVAEEMSVREIGTMLEEKGLIEDANLFFVQELLSAYHGEILPGIYDLSTDMTVEQMLGIMSSPVEEESQESTPVEDGVDESSSVDEEVDTESEEIQGE